MDDNESSENLKKLLESIQTQHPAKNSKGGQSAETSSKPEKDRREDESNVVMECVETDVLKQISAKYGDYGSDIRLALKSLKDSKSDEFTFNSPTSSTWKSRKNISSSLETPTKTSSVKSKFDVYAEPIFGYRMINSIVSSQFIESKMSRRLAVSFSRVKNHLLQGDTQTDWVFAGIVVYKCQKTSRKGKQYCVWKLSDLKSDMKEIQVYLFGKACSELWKISVGTVLAVLNASPFHREAEEHNGKLNNDIVLTVRDADQVMPWGESKDLGFCKSRKKNGDPCTMYVNKNTCEFCIYHAKNEYKKYTGRSELQSQSNRMTAAATARRFKAKNQFKTPAVSDAIFDAPSTMMAGKKRRERDLNTLKTLQNSSEVAAKKEETIISTLPEEEIENKKRSEKPVATFSRLELLKKATERMKSTNELTLISANCIGKKPCTLKFSEVFKDKKLSGQSKMDCDDIFDFGNNEKILRKAQEVILRCDDKKAEAILATRVKRTRDGNFKELTVVERSIRGTCSKTNLDEAAGDVLKSLQFSTSRTNGSCNRTGHRLKFQNARKAAMDWVKRNGPIKEGNPNKILSKPNDTINSKLFVASGDADDQPLKGEGNILSPRFLELMNAESSHRNLMEIMRDTERQVYFEKMEKKEQLEAKLLNTFKMPCKAVRCMRCKYTWFSASEKCKAEFHPLKILDGFKRFFKCGDCGNRTVSLEIIPLTACKKCGSAKWSKAPVIKEKVIENRTSDLSIRGDEENYIGCAFGPKNLNLLMPE